MKLQKMIVGFVGIVLSVIVGLSTVSAQVICSSASVTEVSLIPLFENVTTSKYAVRLLCEDIDDVWTGTAAQQYMLSADMGAAGYAMILTAMASDKKIKFIAQGKTANSLVTKLTILN